MRDGDDRLAARVRVGDTRIWRLEPHVDEAAGGPDVADQRAVLGDQLPFAAVDGIAQLYREVAHADLAVAVLRPGEVVDQPELAAARAGAIQVGRGDEADEPRAMVEADRSDDVTGGGDVVEASLGHVERVRAIARRAERRRVLRADESNPGVPGVDGRPAALSEPPRQVGQLRDRRQIGHRLGIDASDVDLPPARHEAPR